jgi:hypothetical protein
VEFGRPDAGDDTIGDDSDDDVDDQAITSGGAQ